MYHERGRLCGSIPPAVPLRRLKVGIAVACTLIGLMGWALFVPATPKPEIRDRGDELWRTFQTVGSHARRYRRLSLVVAVDSPNQITLTGYAVGGRTITVRSMEEFSRVVGGLQRPGTAVVGFGPSLKGAVLNPPLEIVVTQQRLTGILAANGFRHPMDDNPSVP